jgi:hypothetical protein
VSTSSSFYFGSVIIQFILSYDQDIFLLYSVLNMSASQFMYNLVSLLVINDISASD